MLNVYVSRPQGLQRLPGKVTAIPDDALWLDLINPEPDEEDLIENVLGVDVPTREEMKEIEASNRLYEDEGALYMTITIVTKLDTDLPVNSQITFMLVG
ncbi:MAG TPA: hypothetical protein VFR59_08305, partial [Steroidobacteraceae bacterium]|nr:hypothetical protein [Steroidobacteraceae bacterium]